MIIQNQIKIMAGSVGRTYEEMTGPKWNRELSDTRLTMYVILKEEKNYGPVAISRAFNRNHSTIIKGYESMRSILKSDSPLSERLRKDYDLMSEALSNQHTGILEYDYNLELTIARESYYKQILCA